MKKVKAFGICLYKAFNHAHVEILLCKSVNSKTKWGFLKGGQKYDETGIQTAIREFREESSIDICRYNLEKYFIQYNKNKDICIWLVNYNNIFLHKKYFTDNSLKRKYLCSENSQVRFFHISNIPPIKKKQKHIMCNIIYYFTYKYNIF